MLFAEVGSGRAETRGEGVSEVVIVLSLRRLDLRVSKAAARRSAAWTSDGD